jgi:excisionase family DNA binding protein
MNSKHFLNADEAAQVLRMDSRTLVRWARLGQVPAHPLGDGKRRLWRFIESELIHWLEDRGTPLKKRGTSNIDTAISAHARRTA